MKITVVGGTGLIGTKVVARLIADEQDVVVASRATGVNSFTGDGLQEALEGAEVVVDTSNSGYWDEAGALEFFYVSTLNLLTYGAVAGVRYHIALSVVGTDRLARSEGGYFRGKEAQERLILDSSMPYSIVHSTQFFEYLASMADHATEGNIVRLSNAFIQPIAADDVAAAVSGTAMDPPVNGTVEYAGPDQYRLDELVRHHLAIRDDPRQVVADPLARYLGTQLEERELLPGDDAMIAGTHFEDWLRQRG
jgi:uncharacterized protein YbjT (DUF2867 family)